MKASLPSSDNPTEWCLVSFLRRHYSIMFKMGLEPTAWVQSLALSLASWVTLVMSSSLVPSLAKWDVLVPVRRAI